MNSNTLSAELEKLIRKLCLTDFPCGHGSWRNTTDSTEEAETETDHLLDLLTCPRSPWCQEASWSPQALPLRKLAVRSPVHLHKGFIYSFFTTIRILDKNTLAYLSAMLRKNSVSGIDQGLLKFSKLEELVLSANKITEIPAGNLPSTLKVLELRANRLTALDTLNNCPPFNLQYLGLGSNSLGSPKDLSKLTGRYWPQLVCLDLSDCEFQEQQAMLRALRTLPCLKTLVLEGNPFTLGPAYPGFTVDSLPQLSCLDTSWISSKERQCFSGLTQNNDLIVDRAVATVTVGRVRGIPDPLMDVDDNASEFPIVTYSYLVTYDFLSHQTRTKNCERETPKLDTAETPEVVAHGGNSEDSWWLHSYLQRNGESNQWRIVSVSRHSTSKLTWSECVDFNDTQKYIISDLRGFKKFLNQGLYLRVEEEKVLSWPGVPKYIPVETATQNVKDKKGKKGQKSPVNSDSAKGKTKGKKNTSLTDLIEDDPIRKSLGSIHIPLHSLVKGKHKVDILCDLGALQTGSGEEAMQPLLKDLGKKIKQDKKEDTESKRKGESGKGQKKTASSKGKGKKRKDREVDAQADKSDSLLPQPLTVEFRVELEKWHAASEAHRLKQP